MGDLDRAELRARRDAVDREGELAPQLRLLAEAQAPHGDEVLVGIARELVTEVRRQLKPDWIARESVRTRLRSTIKRLLARNNYPPDQQKEAIDLVLRQMEHFANEWSTNGETGG
ncbi:type I restriction enzyme endonuclease domain-containing protein [Streptomyces sp. TE5632]